MLKQQALQHYLPGLIRMLNREGNAAGRVVSTFELNREGSAAGRVS
jgi:hypothetical protein